MNILCFQILNPEFVTRTLLTEKAFKNLHVQSHNMLHKVLGIGMNSMAQLLLSYQCRGAEFSKCGTEFKNLVNEIFTNKFPWALS